MYSVSFFKKSQNTSHLTYWNKGITFVASLTNEKETWNPKLKFPEFLTSFCFASLLIKQSLLIPQLATDLLLGKL